MLIIPSYLRRLRVLLFFFNDTATTEIYTLSLHDALPISFVVKVRFPEQVLLITESYRIPD